MARLSIIIPALNEAATLGRTLRRVQALQPPAWEVLLVDGGSHDQTVQIACEAGIPVLRSEAAGRALQMNLGARQATGDLLCFLHADTLIPHDLVSVAERTFADGAIAGAGFISLMGDGTATRWGISALNLLKTYLAPLLFRPHLFVRGLRLLFGDQVMLCRRSDFWGCGGFDAALPILEDGDLCLRLVRRGRIVLINRVVESSDRRVQRWGPGRAALIYLAIGVLWGLGVPPSRLKRFYADVR
ncbi:TIGR04283 family arsenosugar biosynthesis glycosyltransferase [Cyanobium sp. NIES-981]|uniref:TIGR04283 family arsenosugar biosynthesis glycosyltransferase n=1 Tax=Cyanobium sp. NIES-981 TaxID=1851505 RepID=UPI0007DCBB94|nr:TIGR04283 family arsenosugar biosynthesis glycosyltransferase [Cyanobium sp. NIES-981]SBO43365.1 Glycosyltransferase involved in cell wall biogenesis [Cyanobium sp. NIES-981]